jgi:hypothetical protein
LPSFLDRSGIRLSEQRVWLGKGVLDGIEVPGLGSQKEQLCAELSDGFAVGFTFVAAEIRSSQIPKVIQCRANTI